MRSERIDVPGQPLSRRMSYEATAELTLDAEHVRDLQRALHESVRESARRAEFCRSVAALKSHIPRDVPYCVLGVGGHPCVAILHFFGPITEEQWIRTRNAIYSYLPIYLHLGMTVREPRCTIHEDCVHSHDLGRECLEASNG